MLSPLVNGDCIIPQRRHPGSPPSLAHSLASRMTAASTWIEVNTDAGKVTNRRNIASSNWANCYRFDTTSGRAFFVKTSRRPVEAMFLGEGEGLR